MPAQTPATAPWERSRRNDRGRADSVALTRRSSQPRRVSPAVSRVAPAMNAPIGASAANFRCRSPLASRSRTTPKIAISAPATSAVMSSRSAIDAGSFLCSGVADAGLDPKLPEADVRVDGQLGRAGLWLARLLPIVVGAAAVVLEHLGRAARDVGGARHAHVRRHEH